MLARILISILIALVVLAAYWLGNNRPRVREWLRPSNHVRLQRPHFHPTFRHGQLNPKAERLCFTDHSPTTRMRVTMMLKQGHSCEAECDECGARKLVQIITQPPQGDWEGIAC
jgi:hypothetical protein